MSKETWYEISQVIKQNRHELVLSGADISKKIQEQGLDKALFELRNLNYLNISETSLEEIPNEISNLGNLLNLVLHSNNIVTLPPALGKLAKLKVLDCSRNKIENLPKELGNLPHLTTINFSSNLIQSIPCQEHNVKLSRLDLSNNKFEIFPDVCYKELVHLAEIKLNENQIKEIPSNISRLPALKVLDLGDNQIKVVPGELAECTKLNDLNLKGNKLSNNRLLKLVDQCRTKQVLDYIRQHCPKASGALPNAEGKSKKGDRNKRHSESENLANTLSETMNKLKVLKVTDDVPVVRITDNVNKVRPHIIACIVKNMSFTDETFKKFIQLQTKLHDGICEKRNSATLATHDFSLLVPGNLTYTAKPPADIKIKPLMRTKMFTGAELFQQLKTEAENLRKEKKRNVYSGIHKYLYLLEGKPVYPCLMDSSDQVISFPPITNSDITKMSTNTTTMFVEVTSATSQQVCRNVMDEFLKELVTQGLGCAPKSEGHQFHEMVIEQVKIVDIEGNMKSVYPSRADLIMENNCQIAVLRE